MPNKTQNDNREIRFCLFAGLGGLAVIGFFLLLEYLFPCWSKGLAPFKYTLF